MPDDVSHIGPGAGEREPRRVLAVLADFDKPVHCSTPYCGYSHGVQFTQWKGGVIADTRCSCGCNNAALNLSDQDVLALLSLGWESFQRLNELVGAHEDQAVVPTEYHQAADDAWTEALDEAKTLLSRADVYFGGPEVGRR